VRVPSAPLDAPVDELHKKLLRHMSDDRLRTLIELLEEARDPSPP
jgi:hypothetical protein